MDRKWFIILVALCVTTHIIRLVYELLKSRKRIKPGKLSFAIIFTNMMLLWMSWFILCSLDPFIIVLPALLRYTGLMICVIGIIAFLAGLYTIRTLESYEGDLITKGIYSVIRHPMYLGFILWLIGFPLFHEALFSFALSFVFIANILYWRHLEEIELKQRFPGYMAYSKKTLF
jgi:protein-S-isoprenylcysteine O-methyltransferase Ste14